MAFSIQTNVNSLIAQENLRVNSNFQSQTIQRLTRGYRINSSGDDAAGLAIANKFRSDTAELTQGVRNANDGISTLQIIDGGMNNIRKMLDRLRTLATQSASDTFTGDRNVLNSEFQSLTHGNRPPGAVDRAGHQRPVRQIAQRLRRRRQGRRYGRDLVPTTAPIAIDLTKSQRGHPQPGPEGPAGGGGHGRYRRRMQHPHRGADPGRSANNTTATAASRTCISRAPASPMPAKSRSAVNLRASPTSPPWLRRSIPRSQNAGNGSHAGGHGVQECRHRRQRAHRRVGRPAVVLHVQQRGLPGGSGRPMANALLGNFSRHYRHRRLATTVVGASTAAAGAAFTPTGVTVRDHGRRALTAAQDITFDSALQHHRAGDHGSERQSVRERGAQGGRHHGQRFGRRRVDVHQRARRKARRPGDRRHRQLSRTSAPSRRRGRRGRLHHADRRERPTTTPRRTAPRSSSSRSTARFERQHRSASISTLAMPPRRLKAATADSDQHGNTITFTWMEPAPQTVTLAAGDTTAHSGRVANQRNARRQPHW